MANELRIFGIRHHGPGSARSLRAALSAFEPDAILVEGPAEADAAIPLAAHADMKPPVAMLVYVPDDPQRAVFYPFALFSPEWIAIQFGLKHELPVRFMDLPQSHRLAIEPKQADENAEESEAPPAKAPPDDADSLHFDPLGRLAEVAGFSDGERWWDYMVETRRGGHTAVFEAVADAMSALREDQAPKPEELEQQREAHMRKTIRSAIKGGFERIAVVCGAWHAPALVEPNRKGRVSSDNALLKGLPKVKTAVAWTPWSYDRLSFRSGYGAGIASPAFYHLLWTHDKDPAVHWMTQVARLMRRQDLDASSAHVIEAVRLAEALAALRGRPLPGLEELDEAALTVMCFGNDAPMQLVRRKLVIGDRLGSVPDDAPLVPLQQDLNRLQKTLRMPASASEKDYDLDLRKPNDLQRSHVLHRLLLLSIPWGKRQHQYGKKGTFHELWRVQWKPEFVVDLITAARWGNTIETAAAAFTADAANQARDLSALTGLLDDAILADLPLAVSALMSAIQERTAVASDVPELMDALPPLARVSRYGNVRQTDVSMVLEVADGLVARICVGLPSTAASLNDEAAHELFNRIIAVHEAIALLKKDDHQEAWNAALRQLADQHGLHSLVAGRAVRLLYDAGVWNSEETARHMSMALSIANDTSQAAAWIEGFLAGSGMLLIHDEAIWELIDEWVTGLSADHFDTILPLVRRTFSTFPAPERRQMGERVKRGRSTNVISAAHAVEFNEARANAVLPMLARILGAEWP